MKNSFYVLWILCVFVLVAGCETPETGSKPGGAENQSLEDSVPDPKSETSIPGPHAVDQKTENEEPRTIPYYRFLTGRIGDDLDIAMNLLVLNDSLIKGSYWYQNVRRPITLTLQELNKQTGEMKLSEKDPDMPFDETISGFFIADFFVQGMIEGRWTNGDGAISFPFFLNDAKPTGNAEILLSEYDYDQQGCEDPEDCLSIRLMEIQVAGIPSNVAEKINTELTGDYARFVFSDPDQGAPQSVSEAVDSLEKWMAREKTDSDESYFQHWSFNASPEIIYNQDDILSFRVDYWSYTGGAHGNPFTLCYNYDLKTGKKLVLSDFLRGTTSPAQVKAAALRRIKLTYEGTLNDDLTDLGFLISDKEFELNEDFYYCPAGINFVYSPYEIGPYAMGFVEVFVPFKALN